MVLGRRERYHQLFYTQYISLNAPYIPGIHLLTEIFTLLDRLPDIMSPALFSLGAHGGHSPIHQSTKRNFCQVVEPALLFIGYEELLGDTLSLALTCW